MQQSWYKRAVEEAAVDDFPSNRRQQANQAALTLLVNPQCPPETIAAIARKAPRRSLLLLRALEHPNCPPDTLREFAQHRALEHPNCPPDTLREFAQHQRNAGIIRAIYCNRNCPVDLMTAAIQQCRVTHKMSRRAYHTVHNPSCPQELIRDLIYSMDCSDLTATIVYTDRMMPEYFEHILLYRGLYDEVSRRALTDNRCPANVLSALIRKKRYTVETEQAINNPNCSVDDIVWVLRSTGDNRVTSAALLSPKCPPEVLAKNAILPCFERVSNVYQEWLTRPLAALTNPNCPSEAIVTVLSRGIDDRASLTASKHPNCPPEARIKWMRAIGQIEVEDSTKHTMEPPRQQVDTDIAELQNLIGCHHTWYKSAGSKLPADTPIEKKLQSPTVKPDFLQQVFEKKIPSGGNFEYAIALILMNPNCPPAILAAVLDDPDKSLAHGRHNLLAIDHPNCPSEAMNRFITRRPSGMAAEHIAANPKCPPQTLIRLIQKWRKSGAQTYDRFVSVIRGMLRNPNCPPECLGIILTYGQDTWVSERASQHPNAPEKERIAWQQRKIQQLQNTGEIETEDPAKHILESPKPTDPDIDELKNLLGYSQDWLKFG